MHSQVADNLPILPQHEIRLISTVIEVSIRKMNLRLSNKTDIIYLNL